MPLLAKVRRGDDEDTALSLGPALRHENTRLDGFAETDFIGEERAV